MSVHISSEVWKDKTTTGNARLLLLALADMANDEGVCWPSINTLKERLNLGTDRAIQQLLKGLEEQGFVSRELRSGHSTLYRVKVFRGEPSFTPTPERTFTPEQPFTPNAHSPHPRTAIHQGGEPSFTPPPNSHSPRTVNEPSMNPKGTDNACGDPFWSEEGNLDTTPVEPLPVATSSERDRMRKEQERIKAQKLDLINAFAEAINPGAPVTQAFINANISAAGSLVSVGATPDLVRLAVQNHRLSWPAKTVFDLKFIESRWSSLTAVKPATPEPAAEPKHYTYDFERENWSREKMQAFIAQKKKESAEGRAYILARMNAGDFNSAESRTGGNHGQNGGVQ